MKNKKKSTGKLTFIGFGLYDEKDISLKALEEIKESNEVFAEFYTSKLTGTTIEKIEEIIGRNITVLSREETERGDEIINSALEGKKVVFLTCGDTMTATTHVDLRLRAHDNDIPTMLIPNASIITAAPALLGLQNYKFGRTTTLVYPKKNFSPVSPYDVIENNKKKGLHTLILLDIEADNNRFMTANEGLQLLLEMEKKLGRNITTEETVMCVVARAGSKQPLVRADSIKCLIKQNFGPPLHTLVALGELHFKEIEGLQKLAQLPADQLKKLQKI